MVVSNPLLSKLYCVQFSKIYVPSSCPHQIILLDVVCSSSAFVAEFPEVSPHTRYAWKFIAIFWGTILKTASFPINHNVLDPVLTQAKCFPALFSGHNGRTHIERPTWTAPWMRQIRILPTLPVFLPFNSILLREFRAAMGLWGSMPQFHVYSGLLFILIKLSWFDYSLPVLLSAGQWLPCTTNDRPGHTGKNEWNSCTVYQRNVVRRLRLNWLCENRCVRAFLQAISLESFSAESFCWKCYWSGVRPVSFTFCAANMIQFRQF